MKKIIALLLVVSLVLFGCSANTNVENPENAQEVNEPIEQEVNEPEENVLSDGNYIATADGYGGELEVELIVKDGLMREVNLIKHDESSPVITRALPLIQERILEAQTPVVDSITGATFSSFAIKSAVAKAAKEAGVDFGEVAMKAPDFEEPTKELENDSTNFLIVGGGPAGLAAAISAKENGVEDIIVIEKLDILSGNGKFDMMFFNFANTKAQKELGIEDSAEALYEDLLAGKHFETNEKIWSRAQGVAQMDEWLRGMDIQLNYIDSGRNHFAESDAYAGEEVQDGLEARVKELDIDVRTGTKALDLIMDENKVVGVKVQKGDGTYDIMASSVLIATGGFCNNKDLLEEYIPEAVKFNTSNQIGATGDMIPVAIDHNLKLGNMDQNVMFGLAIPIHRDLTGAKTPGAVVVNKNGERFVNEQSTYGFDFANKVYEQEDHQAYYIYDQKLFDSTYRLQKHNKLGLHYKTDTLEELANELGINAENLVKSVEQFNAAARGEIADPFAEKAFDIEFSMDGPFYGTVFEPVIHMTRGGIVTDEFTQVLNDDGEIVEGLYAAGEVTATQGIYLDAIVFGRLAGEKVAENLQ